MAFPALDLDRLVYLAATLRERLEGAADPAAAHPDGGDSELLERWAETSAGGDPGRFRRRLEWDRVQATQALRALRAEPQNRAPGSRPAWVGTLMEISAAAVAGDWADGPPPLDPAAPLLYEEVLLPVVLVARRRLRERLEPPPSGAPGAIGPDAMRDLERALLRRLTALSARAIHAEHVRAIPTVLRLRRRLLGTAGGGSAREHYDTLVSSLLAQGLSPLFGRYPVLARLLVIALEQWVESSAELVSRVTRDLPEIQRAFGTGGEADGESRVVAVHANLSDFHQGGRSVAVLTFGNGVKVVYKPKTLDLDRAFAELVGWLNARGAVPSLTTPLVLAKRGYGYVSFVVNAPCVDAAAAARLYERAGMLLALIHGLGGTDCHRENLVAAGDELVLVDLETLMHHDARPMSDTDAGLATEATDAVTGRLRGSILRTGLLPRWQTDGDGDVFDVGGLGRMAGSGTMTEVGWVGINTDDVDLVPVRIEVGPDAATPLLDGTPLSAEEHVDRIAAGFERMYRLLESRREELLAPGGPLAAMRGLPVRFIFRPTRVYAGVQNRAIAPEALRDGASRGIELDALARGFLSSPTCPAAWPILQAEVEAMERLDVPLFSTRSDSDALPLGGEAVLHGYFEARSHDRMVDQIGRLGPDDLARQIELLRLTFLAQTVTEVHAEGPRRAPVAVADAPAMPTPARDVLLAAAEAIAEEIERRAVRGRDGSAAWIDVGHDAVTQRFHVQPTGLGLYDGGAGIGLFLAALERAAGKGRFRSLAEGSLMQTRRVLTHADREAAAGVMRRMGLGGVTGLGSMIYVLVRVASLLDDDSFLEDAILAADLLDPARIAADEQLDVMGGVAGALLALLALHLATGKGMDKALACGRRLVERRASVHSGPATWRTLDGRPLAGFSHGAAGIAHALIRLYEATGERSFRAAASDGIEWERCLYSPEGGGWPDLRGPHGPRFPTSWCNGAAGIALARAAAGGVLGAGAVQEDLERAVGAIGRAGWGDLDHLCCGNAGKVEALLVASLQPGRGAWRSLAEEGAAAMLGRLASPDGVRLFSHPAAGRVSSPGFFRGTAGIGYQLLRVARPDLLPSVLLLE